MAVGQPIMGIATVAAEPYGSAQAQGTPVMGIPEAKGVVNRTTYTGGMMDYQSTQLQANTLVYGEPPAETDQSKVRSVIPQMANGKAPCINESDALFRETLLYMRICLKSDMKFFDSCKLINTVLQNILKNPLDDKYCKLRLTNPGIKKNITDIMQAKFLLELLGFETIPIIPDAKPGQPVPLFPEDYLVLMRDRADPRDMQHLCGILIDLEGKKNLTPLTSKIQLSPQQRQ